MQIARPGQHIGMAQEDDRCCQLIVGLPALHRSRLYMVPFTTEAGEDGRRLVTNINHDLTDDTQLLCVNWRVQFT